MDVPRAHRCCVAAPPHKTKPPLPPPHSATLPRWPSEFESAHPRCVPLPPATPRLHFPPASPTACTNPHPRAASSGCSPLSVSCTLDASVRTPATRNCVNKIGNDIPATIGKCSAAPAEARNAFGEYGLAVPLCPEAASRRARRSERRGRAKMVPTFPGSCTPASTTSSGEQTPSGGAQ